MHSAPRAARVAHSARTVSTHTPTPTPAAPQFTRSGTSNLPVYTDYKNGRTRIVTIVRRYTGDEGALAAEVRRVLGGAQVTVVNGRIEVAGNHSAQLRTWMAGLGF